MKSSPSAHGGVDSRVDATDREVRLDVFIAQAATAARDARIDFPEDVVYEQTDLATSTQSREERIRCRAHEIFLERSRAVSAGDAEAVDERGDAVSDWLAAERELLEPDDASERR